MAVRELRAAALNAGQGRGDGARGGQRAGRARRGHRPVHRELAALATEPERGRRKQLQAAPLTPVFGTLGRGWTIWGHRVSCPRPSHSRPLARTVTARVAPYGSDTRFRYTARNQLPAPLQDAFH